MNNEEFVGEFSGAPWDMEEIAEVAEEKCNDSIGVAAKEYLTTLSKFYNTLNENGYEFG